MANKEFTTIAKAASLSLPVRAVAFDGKSDGGCFVSLKIGHTSFGEFGAIISPTEARAIADILRAAADFAEPRVVSAADLGLVAA